ncbi:hypothetical protein DENSPDRAFT_875686 [Dentipellis sp. KUC8613]|nr:hypothetical protein DENSPDRAFT_875686 [Dentipellis sp. KUC8613]
MDVAHREESHMNSDFERLDNDVLILIIDILILEDCKSFKELSSVSKRLRSVCIPILFKTVQLYCGHIWRFSIPPAAWPYLRTWMIIGDYSEGPGLDAKKLTMMYPHLVALRKLVFLSFKPGVYWYQIQSLMAIPNIRALEIQEPLDWEREDFSFFYESIDPPSATLPFTEFVYSVADADARYWNYAAKPKPTLLRCYMTPLLLSLHQNLEVLHLPAWKAPLSEMASIDWPRLQELKLEDDNYEGDDATIFARLCSRMPSLRTLDFQFLNKGAKTETLIWPAEAASLPMPFSHLRTVYLPHPDPNDTFYAHLPSTLKQLRLVDCPRYYRFEDMKAQHFEGYRRPTLLSATDLLRLLNQLQGTFDSLDQFEVAFRADGQETALYRFIVTTFPNLRWLQLHRYRAHGDSYADIETAVTSIVHHVSSLHRLRHIRLYLNLPDDDDKPIRLLGRDNISGMMSRPDFADLLLHHATTIVMGAVGGMV